MMNLEEKTKKLINSIINEAKQIVDRYSSQDVIIAGTLYGEDLQNAKRIIEQCNKFKEEKREVLQIKFVGIDSWNRPLFRPAVNKKQKFYLSDVYNLFDDNTTEKEIKLFYEGRKPLREYITYHGSSIDVDPHGGKVKYDLEIV